MTAPLSIEASQKARSVAARATAPPRSVYSPDLVVLRLEREDTPYRYLDIVSVLPVVERCREAIISHCNDLPDRVRGLLSGHQAHGAPLNAPHLTFLPLASVGHPRADGRLLGIGLALPVGASVDDRRHLLRAIGRVRYLALGRLGRWRLVSDVSASPWSGLRPEMWTAYPHGATHWSTVTPVVFDRHPKAEERGAHRAEVGEMIATACTRIGLPEPREVIVTQASAHVAVPPAFAFPRLRRKDGSERRHAHAILVFAHAVCGPVVIGAGRYRGYGVSRGIQTRKQAVDDHGRRLCDECV